MMDNRKSLFTNKCICYFSSLTPLNWMYPTVSGIHLRPVFHKWIILIYMYAGTHSKALLVHGSKVQTCLPHDSSSGSPMPLERIANCVSISGRHGESYILHIRVFPRPFLNCNLRDNLYAVVFYLSESISPCSRCVGHNIPTYGLFLV